MMKRSTVDNWIKAFVWGAVITGVLLAANYCNAATKTKEQKTCWLPEGCTVQYQDNPFTYKPGAVSVSGIVDDAVVIRVQPLATYALFTEDILLCDRANVEQKFENKHNPVVLTYKTAASRLVQSVGCHELVRVDELAR
jgi:hypothetical protein